MLTDLRAIEQRIKLLQDQNIHLKKELRFADPILKITMKGRRVSSVEGQVSANEHEIMALKRRLEIIKKHKENNK